MSIVIYTKNQKRSNSWKVVLQDELPDHKIEVYPSVEDYNNVELLICWKPYHGLIGQFPNLKAIQSLGAGVDHIFDTNPVESHIQVSKIVDNQLTQDMWEHVLGIVLLDMKNFAFYSAQQKTKNWKPRRYKRFNEIKIGILGLGTIGSFVATHFATLGFEVLGWSRSKKDIYEVATFEGEPGLDMVCKDSDYLINILPLTKATRGILNKEMFSKMKPSSYIINVGRGPHLVDEDLLESLDSELIRGASLDVFHTEPLPESHDFWTHPLIQITPHVASLTNLATVYPQVVENIKRLDLGEPLLNTIDVEIGY